MTPVRRFEVERLERGAREARADEVVVEEPLEIRVSGETLAITMRTPGSDRDLVLGFLFAEGIIRDADDVTALAPCGRTGDEGRENTLEVTLAPGVVVPGDDGPFARRGTITTSACGVCGRRSIEDLLTRFTPLEDGLATISHSAIAQLAAGLRERQPI
ncbi:MAG TPA: formate dehydrogenase accessory sulfurtransferase FdhD, partial [Labilithrix sp.]|nr:formate dehydrogenase accessory sulfurtransferase FdhD [Labilithrix sp.]